MSEGTKSLNATHKPDPKPDVVPPEAAESAAGPVELTAMVILSSPLTLLTVVKVENLLNELVAIPPSDNTAFLI
jgi:hypothetical protein